MPGPVLHAGDAPILPVLCVQMPNIYCECEVMWYERLTESSFNFYNIFKPEEMTTVALKGRSNNRDFHPVDWGSCPERNQKLASYLTNILTVMLLMFLSDVTEVMEWFQLK